MSGRRTLGLVCGVALLAAAAPAAAPAQDRDEASDRPPVVVAGPQGDAPGARLLLRSAGRELCLEIGDAPDGRYEGGLCTNFHARDVYEPFFADVVQETDTFGDEQEPRRVGGAVRAAIHYVEYHLSGGRRVTFPTVAAPAALQGTPAGELRFFLGELPEPSLMYSARLLDAEGRVVAEIEVDHDDEGPPPLERPLRIASGIERGEDWSITATVESRLAPIRGDVTRRARALCLRERRSSANGGGRGGRRCFPRPFDEASFDFSSSCDRRGRHVIFGVAERGRAPLAAVLGDGSRVGVRPVALPAAWGFGAATAWVVLARPGMAVRALIFPPGSGEPTFDVGLAPPGVFPCGSVGFFYVDPFEDPGPPGPGGDAEIGTPGSPPLYVRDAGEELCLAPARPTRVGECAAPGPWLGDALVNLRPDGSAAAGAVDPRVGTVRVGLSDGTTFDLPTHPGERYTGRYAGQLAFFSVAAPTGRRIISVELLDEAGTVLAPVAFGEPRLAEDPRTLLRSHGVLVGAARLEALEGEDRPSCLVVGRGALPRRGDHCENDLVPPAQIVVGVVSCAVRAMVLTVGLTPGAATATARLGDGSRRRLRIRRAPTGERVGVLVVPPRLGLRGVTVRSRRGAALQRHRVALPPAARQCGYGFFSFGRI